MARDDRRATARSRGRRVSRRACLLLLGAAVVLWACLAFGAAASYDDTTAMRGAREGRAPLEVPRSRDAYLIVAGVQKCGTTELQQWLKRLPRVRHNNLEPHFFDCLAGGPCDTRCVPRAYRPGGCHGNRYELTVETLDAYRRDFKAIPRGRALGLVDADALRLRSGEALPWLHLEKTPSYYAGPHKGASILLQLECLAIECVRKSIHLSRT